MTPPQSITEQEAREYLQLCKNSYQKAIVEQMAPMFITQYRSEMAYWAVFITENWPGTERPKAWGKESLGAKKELGTKAWLKSLMDRALAEMEKCAESIIQSEAKDNRIEHLYNDLRLLNGVVDELVNELSDETAYAPTLKRPTGSKDAPGEKH